MASASSLGRRAGVIAVAGLTVVHGRVSAVALILDPDKLALLTID